MALVSFSGLASGIDSQALIKAFTTQTRQARVSPLQDTINKLTDTNTVFDELSDKLESLKAAAYKFRAISGGAVSKTGTSTDESVLTASAGNSALNSSFTVTVNQIAKNSTYSFNDTNISSSSSALVSGLAGTDTISVETGTGSDKETVTLNVTNTTTLEDLATNFNSTSNKSTASIVNVGTSASPTYKLVFTSNYEGTQKGTVAITVGANIQAQGRFTAATTSQATDSQFSITGITGSITRSTNQISDVVSGVTLNFNKAGTSTVTISNDSASSTETIQDFVDAYNEVNAYIKENDLITREDSGDSVNNIFGPLASSSIDNNILTALRTSLSNAGKTGSSINVLADIGITTERDGSLKFNTAVFNSALSSEPNSVRTITEDLGEDLAAVDGTIAQFTQYNGTIDLAVNANKTQITNFQDKISLIERSISQQESALTGRFSRLESLISKLTSQQQQLSSILGSL